VLLGSHWSNGVWVTKWERFGGDHETIGQRMYSRPETTPSVIDELLSHGPERAFALRSFISLVVTRQVSHGKGEVEQIVTVDDITEMVSDLVREYL
jgi:hypothetical protein